MTNCICSFFWGLWCCVVGSLRVILCIACGVMLISKIFGFWALYMLENYISEFEFPGTQVGLTDYILLIALTLVSLMGAHGAYTKNPTYLKAFALIMVVYAVVYFLMFLTVVSTYDWGSSNKKFISQMKNYAKEYEHEVPKDHEPNRGTRAWDLIQSKLNCCGLKDSSDWKAWSKQLPSTCCTPVYRHWHDASSECPSGKRVYDTGCLQRIDDLVASVCVTAIYEPIWYIFLACISIIVAKQNDPDVVVSTNQSSDTQRPYQRFEGSVYIRQPPVNEAYVQSETGKGSQKQSDPMYPNITGSNVAPPSYS